MPEFKVSCLFLLKVVLFCFSVLSGALFAVVWRNYELTVSNIATLRSPVNNNLISRSHSDLAAHLGRPLESTSYDQWLRDQGLQSEPIPREELSYGSVPDTIQIEADFLFNKSKVLCMILSSSRLRGNALNQTWTKHCNNVVFYSKYRDKKLKTTPIKILDDNLLSTRTFCKAFVDLVGRQFQYDWLLISTDHTYAIVENLRQYVAPLNSSNAYYIGRPVHHYFLGTYNAFDSGIVLSHGAVDLLSAGVFHDVDSCVNLKTNGLIYSGLFDAFIGMELARHNCVPFNSLDNGSSRFHPFRPERHIFPELISAFDNYWSSNILSTSSGLKCCSERAITFTGFSSVTMYFLEYLLYHLVPFRAIDGQKGLGNQQPSYETFIVPSDMDGKTPNSPVKNIKFAATATLPAIPDEIEYSDDMHRLDLLNEN